MKNWIFLTIIFLKIIFIFETKTWICQINDLLLLFAPYGSLNSKFVDYLYLKVISMSKVKLYVLDFDKEDSYQKSTKSVDK